jgi:hypothetical protein
MAFDIDEFLKQEEKNKSVAAPVVTDTSGGFDVDAFLSDPANAQGSGAEPAMVADVPTGVAPPGTPMATPPTPGGTSIPVPGTDYQMPFQPPVVNPAGPGLAAQIGQSALGQQAGAMAQNTGKIAQPFATSAGKVMNAYVNNPITKLAPDLAAVSMGVPPPYATSQAIGATQGAYNVARKLPTPGVATGLVAPTSQQVATNPMLAEMARLQATAQAETLANRSVIQKIAMSKVMQAAAPALNTAARVAGPAGLAYNAYEAGQMARETQLGERLAAGQGRTAQKSFRNMNVPFGAGFNQTITPDQARTILASQSARDIQAFGGLDFLRKKALGQQ